MELKRDDLYYLLTKLKLHTEIIYIEDETESYYIRANLPYMKEGTYTIYLQYYKVVEDLCSNKMISKRLYSLSNNILMEEIKYIDNGYLTTKWDNRGRKTSEEFTGLHSSRTFVTKYFSNGNIKEKGILYEGKKDGEWLRFYTDGNIREIKKYEDGKILK